MRKILGAIGAFMLAVSMLVLSPTQAHAWPDTASYADCTPWYSVGAGNEDRFCMRVWVDFDPPDDGAIIYRIRVSAPDPSEYEDPSAKINSLAITEGPDWCTSDKCPAIWGRADQYVDNTAERNWYPGVRAKGRCIATVWLSISPYVDNWGEADFYRVNVSFNVPC